MAVVDELIRLENDGSLSFGNYTLDTKKKVLDFEVNGDLYKVKTFKEITKLEKNGKLLLEAVPGATIHNFYMDGRKVAFKIEGSEDIQITMELESDLDYEIYIKDVCIGKNKTNLAGKISFNVSYDESVSDIRIDKA